jgi:hypothetical protein
MYVDIGAQVTTCDLSNLDLFFKEIGLKVPVDKIGLVKLQIDPDNTGKYIYVSLYMYTSTYFLIYIFIDICIYKYMYICNNEFRCIYI